jgi:tellurite resistance protein TerA
MPELNAKITLKSKGEEAYVAVKQLMVTLKWTADVDLDLMAFYRAKDGRTGAVISDNYPGGSLGSLNAFPYILLSGDAGIEAAGGDNVEELRIAELDDLEAVYICAVNYTDASKSINSKFADYDGGVIVTDDKGESIGVPLDSAEEGHVAVIARLDNSGMMGPKLVNENKIMDLRTFVNTVPGASAIIG